MKHKSKDRLARSLASQLTNFYPDYVDTFLCPTCLTPVPLADKDQISDAHIVPKSVGGTIRTVLCKPCNDKFGSTQDLWFGDALHPANVEHPYFQARKPPTKFEIEGMTVTGVYGVTESGGLRFTIFEDR